MRFSQRMGFTRVADTIQIKSMNDELRASLWNVLLEEEFDTIGFLDRHQGYDQRIWAFSRALWSNYFKLPADDRPTQGSAVLAVIRTRFFESTWYEAYDFIEFCAEYHGEPFIEPLNKILERELSGCRIIDGIVALISSPEEVQSIQEAIDDETFPGASAHLRTALVHLSRKTNPDYRNSIKESISAVESVSCALTGSKKATLDSALKKFAETHPLHPALKEGFVKLYGYTSDGDGIRHGMLKESKLSQADAVYFLVSCSAFVNYLKVKSSE